MHFRSYQQWLVLFLLLLCATTLAYVLDPYVSFTSQAMVYVLVVAIAAYRLDRANSILCAIASVLLLNFFFVPPRWTFHVDQSEHLIALITLIIVALVINHLSTHLKNETASAQLNEKRAQQLQDLAINLMSVDTPHEIKEVGQRAFASAFSQVSVIAIIGQNQQLEMDQELSEHQINGLYCCIKELSNLGAGSYRWGELDDWYLPIGQAGSMFGAVCLMQAPRDDAASLVHARGLCALLSQAYARLHLNTSMQEARRAADKQGLQATFLSAISHDLRTPLAVIVAAASALQSQGKKLSPDEHARLLKNILDEANYLTTITENTLQLVRLENAPNSLRRDWESIEEIIGSVLKRIRQQTTAREIIVNVAPALPLLRLDPVLIAQLLNNLLDNALKYSENLIEIGANIIEHNNGRYLGVTVKDRGPGVPEAERESIFQAYSRLAYHDQSSQRSAGLGLAVCRAIADAHQAQLSVRPRRAGGSCFMLYLPLSDNAPEINVIG